MPTTPLNTGDGPASRQLDAYNRRDVTAFALAFAPDVRVYTYPDALRYEGREALREAYAGYFEAHPELHCELISRVYIGDRVIDEERVTRVTGKPPVKAVAIYEVRDDLIHEVRFLM